MVNYEHSDLFFQDNVEKQLTIDYGEGQLTNEQIYFESFSLEESLSSESELRFGGCEASLLKFKIANVVDGLKDKRITVSTVLNSNAEAPFLFGKYKIHSDVPSGDRNYRDITAYDSMYDIINAEMISWYNSLEFPMTQKAFRDSFFAFLGVEQKETSLIHDSMEIGRTIETDSISGKDIITSICELNGVFGHINRNGLFEYVSLENKIVGTYPRVTLYPRATLYTGQTSEVDYSKFDINSSMYRSCEYEDFETDYITKVQIRLEENDIGGIAGNGSNTYIIQDNFLVYGKSARELQVISVRILEKIKGIKYRPFKSVSVGNPCLEVGDIVRINSPNKEIEGYILERTISGIQALKDTYEAKGVKQYAEKVNSVNREIKRIKGKTNVLARTVEMLNSEINDEETGLKSQIKQTSEKVEAKVSKGEVSSEISLELGKILLKGNRIAIQSDYFTLSEDGNVVMQDAVAKNLNIEGGNIILQSAENASVFTLLRNSGDTAFFIRPGRLQGQCDGGSIALISTGSIIPAMVIFNSSGKTVASISQNSSLKNLSVSGTKSRLAKTQSYNDRLLYCYEMPSPIFGDIGHGVIGDDGLCYVDIDQIFFETVDTNQSYQVFLQSYAENNVYVIEKQPQYFVVKGLPNTEFDWEIKAKQLDFPLERLEESIADEDYQETDYIALANEYLNQYEQEVLSYE